MLQFNLLIKNDDYVKCINKITDLHIKYLKENTKSAKLSSIHKNILHIEWNNYVYYSM